jgi:hypothetical protein
MSSLLGNGLITLLYTEQPIAIARLATPTLTKGESVMHRVYPTHGMA